MYTCRSSMPDFRYYHAAPHYRPALVRSASRVTRRARTALASVGEQIADTFCSAIKHDDPRRRTRGEADQCTTFNFAYAFRSLG